MNGNGHTEDRSAEAEQAGRNLVPISGEDSPEQHPIDKPRGVLRSLEKLFLLLDRAIERVVPDSLNPLQHTGAIAVVSFLVATVTGIALLIWYRPSVNLAYESVQGMSASPYTAGLVRSLHRYSSDATVFFGLVHAIRFFLERRFSGARWLAWVTGGLMMTILWFIGWTGYWLVWDMRAQLIAVGSSRAVDVIPVFVDPLVRSFLTDEGVNSLLFFVVFFVHMIIPLAMGVVLWIHITRLNRPKFLTTRPMTAWILGSLLLLSLVYPATTAVPARMTAIPREMTIDWWYLLPLAFTDRLEGGALWAIFLLGGAFLLSIPWWLSSRRPAPARVVATRCNECQKCYTDCPYGAIQMVARTDGNEKYLTQASVVDSKCVSCGICAGSCDTAGIGLQEFQSIEQRRRMESWLKNAEAAGETCNVAFVCTESAAAGLTVNADTGLCDELPGYRVLEIPCAGWVHPLMIERAFRNGAEGVMIAACAPGECHYREGGEWMRQRLSGEREPALRPEKVDEQKVAFVELDRTRTDELVSQALALRESTSSWGRVTTSPALSVAAAIVFAIVAAGIMGLVSDFGYASPAVDGSELVVSFKHPGAMSENCRELSAEEIAAVPVHMRQKRECERMRAPVRLHVEVDGKQALQRSFDPTGLWGDGSSVAVERIPLPVGKHSVAISIGDSLDADEWTFKDARTLEFDGESKQVVIFDRLNGFTWH
jgi:coenzyme F420-reducing hydrogenase delta subunit/Pyruvate/2-oxoacid:ferredoxin oxidoreductase delta subunit